MADPLSIVSGVLSLLSASIATGNALKAFYDGVSLANTKVQSLITEVDSFTKMLYMMKTTLEQENIQVSLRSTGHIASHVENIETSILDGQETLSSLKLILEKVQKSSNSMSKYMRLKNAAEQIVIYRQQIQSYRETLYLTLETVILWNQVELRKSTDQIIPNLNKVETSVRRLAEDINGQISSLQVASETTANLQPGSDTRTNEPELQNLRNLRNCVKSSATIVSSASTTLGIGRGSEKISVTYASDFGDIFPPEPAEPMQRWISSRSDYGYIQERGPSSSVARPSSRKQKRRSLDLIQEGSGVCSVDDSEYDSELEAEMLESLLQEGKDKLDSHDFKAAENKFRNCLGRINSSHFSVSLDSTLEARGEITALLLTVFRHQEKWDAARSLLQDEITREARVNSKDSSIALAHTLSLVEVLMKKSEYKEALSMGKRVYKSYRNLDPPEIHGVQTSLELLCRICKVSGSPDEEEAWGAVLRRLRSSQSPPIASVRRLHSGASRHASSGSTSSMDYPPLEGLAIRRLNESLSASGSGRKSAQQLLSPTLSMSTARSSDVESWATRQSRDPPSPATEYSFASSNPYEEQVSYKDMQTVGYRHDASIATTNVPNIREPIHDKAQPSVPMLISPVKLDTELYSQRSKSEDQTPRFLGAGNVYRSTSLSQKTDPRQSDLSLESEESTSGISRPDSKSVPPPPPHKPKHLRHGHSDPISTQISPKMARGTKTDKLKSVTLDDLPWDDDNRNTPSSWYELDRKDKRVDTQTDNSRSESESDNVYGGTVRLPARTNTHKSFGQSVEDTSKVIVKPKYNSNNPFFHSIQSPTQVLNKQSEKSVGQTSVQGVLFEYPDEILGMSKDVAFSAPAKTHNVHHQYWDDTSSSAHRDPIQTMLTRPENLIDSSSISSPTKSTIGLLGSGLVDMNGGLLPKRENKHVVVDMEAPSKHKDKQVRMDSASFYANDDAQEGRIRTLMEMGFDRSRSVMALQVHSQDLDKAANYLLGESVEDTSQQRRQQQDLVVPESGSGHAESKSVDKMLREPTDERIAWEQNLSRERNNEEIPQVQVSTEHAGDEQDSDPEGIYHDDSNHRPIRKLPDPPAYRSIDHASSSGLLSPKVLPKSNSVDTKRPTSSEKLEFTGILPPIRRVSMELKRPITSRAHVKKVSFGSATSPTQSLDIPSKRDLGQGSEDGSSVTSEQPVHNQAFMVPKITTSNDEGDQSSSRTPYVPSLGYSSEKEVIYTNEKEVTFQSLSPGVTSLDTQWNSRHNAGGSPGAPWPTAFPTRKVAICGNALCGKTSLISVISKGIFPDQYDTSPVACTKVPKEARDQMVDFVLWDLGNDLSSHYYDDANFVIICFSISDPGSLRSAQMKYVPLIKSNNASVRYMLVGLQKDRRQNRERLPMGFSDPVVTVVEGQMASRQMEAVNYMECSAKTGEGVIDLFDAVVDFAMMPSEKLTRMKSFRNLLKRTGKKT